MDNTTPQNVSVRRKNRKTRFGQVPEWIFRRHLKDAWLYGYLDCRYGGLDEIFPGLKTIASDLGVSHDTVQRALTRLKTGGAIEVQHRYRDDGGQTTSTLLLVWDDPLEA